MYRIDVAALRVRSDLEESPRTVQPLRFGVVEDAKTGRFFRQRRDGLVDLQFTNATAYYIDGAGTPVLLEPPPGPKTRAELAAREEARALGRSGMTP